MVIKKLIIKILTILITTQLTSIYCSAIVFTTSNKSLKESNNSEQIVSYSGDNSESTSTDITVRARSIDNRVNSDDFKWNVRCPRPEDIHPCTCQEFNKGMESEFQEMEENFETDADLDEALLQQATAQIMATNDTIIIEDKITFKSSKRKTRSQPHPDTIETLVFCKYISHEQVLIDALKGFNGHRVDHFIIDSCILPGFPNRLFTNIKILWMQILNTTIHFEETFFQCAKDCI